MPPVGKVSPLSLQITWSIILYLTCVGRVILLGREADRGAAASVALVEGARHVLSTGDTVRFHCE